MGQAVGVRQGDCMSPVLLLFMVMDFAETLENEWIKAGLQMVTLKQHSHSPRDVDRITNNKKKNSDQGNFLVLFFVLYVDYVAFHFEDRDQLTRGLSLIFSHFTRFGLEMCIWKGDKASKNEYVFFPTPGFFEWKQIFPVDDGDMDERVLMPKRKHESYEARHKREDLAYDDLSETRLIVLLDGFVTFF